MSPEWTVKSGRGDWIRTSDPLRPRQVRYQAALRPNPRRFSVSHINNEGRDCPGPLVSIIPWPAWR